VFQCDVSACRQCRPCPGCRASKISWVCCLPACSVLIELRNPASGPHVGPLSVFDRSLADRVLVRSHATAQHVPPTTEEAHMTTALLVIDVQQSFMHRPFWRADDVPDFIARLQQLIDRCAARDIPVVQVFHEQEKEGPNGPFSRYSGLVKTLQEMRIDPVAVFHKSVHSAMFARAADGQTLEQWL